MKSILLSIAIAVATLAPVQAQESAHSMPDWWVAHVDFMARGGGVWEAPNPGAAADPAQPDAFRMHWQASNGGHVLTGRLFGIEDGEPTADFWSFKEYWHPGERRALLEQWGGPGVYGVGEVRMDGNRGTLDQTFWLPDGRDWREGHRTVENGDEYVTEQFDIGEDGSWTPNGSYTWRRVAPS
ncbi:MAG: hypothetical protein AB7P07_09390 [Hyphomonadaceae bacterium]